MEKPSKVIESGHQRSPAEPTTKPETALEKQPLQKMAGRVITFVTLYLAYAIDKLILSEGGVEIGLGKSTQSQG